MNYTLEEIRALIRDTGLRCTASRTTVLECLINASTPLSHADLITDLVPKGFDQATIYRNLTDLTEVGLLNRLELGDRVWRFEFRGTKEHHDSDHPHFLCTDCGDITCLTTVDINLTDAADTTPSVGEINEIFLKGRCTKCS